MTKKLERLLPLFITLALLPLFYSGSISWNAFLLLAIPGFLGTLSSTSLTKGLSIGTVAIVTPIISTWALVTAILSFLFLGEQLTPLKGAGILLTMTGIIFVSTNFREIVKTKRVKLLAGAEWACLTALGWGTLYFLLALFSRQLGWFTANLSVRFWSALGFVILASLRKKSIPQLVNRIPKIIYFLAIFDVAIFLTFNKGLTVGEPAVVSAVTAASPLVSSILASRFLGETTTRSQKGGIGLVVTGLICLTFA